MSINIYRTELPTHATLLVFHETPDTSTIVRVEKEDQDVTVISHISHDDLPGYLEEATAIGR